jgi:subtilisin family serine protease
MTLLLASVLLLWCARAGAGDRRHDVNEWRVAVHLQRDGDADALAQQLGMVNLGLVGALERTYVFQSTEQQQQQQLRRRSGLAPAELNGTLLDRHPHVRWWQRQHARRLAKRAFAVFDPEFKNQWHLRSGAASVNAQSAWDGGALGADVTVCIVDDGLQMTHPDLQASFREELSYDFNDDDPDVTPDPAIDDHGTSAAGACCADRNMQSASDASSEAFCGVGVAPRARLSAVRLVSRMTEDYQEAGAIGHKADGGNDVFSNSWGPPDDGMRLEGPGPLAARAREHAMQVGRNGLGAIYVWAAGNGRQRGDNCNYDGWANHRYALTIGAISEDLEQPYYSENCAAMFAVAPSGGAQRAITTTDLLGGVGTSSGACTSRFGGTSAAAPIAAGIVALILGVNRRLGWRDVQGIFALSSRPVSTFDDSWFVNGAKLRFSHRFGFGLVDAGRAVEMARTWSNYASPSTIGSGVVALAVPIEPAGKAVYDWHCENVHKRVLHVDVTVNITFAHRGDLRINVESPSGTVSELQEVHSDPTPDIFNWTFSTVANWHEDPHGKWKVTVQNNSHKNKGVWTGIHVLLHLVDK